MFDWFRYRHKPHEDSPKKDRFFIVTLILLAGFIIMSLVTGICSGTFRALDFGFRFHFSDGAAIIVLAAAYLIYRIKGGRKHDR